MRRWIPLAFVAVLAGCGGSRAGVAAAGPSSPKAPKVVVRPVLVQPRSDYGEVGVDPAVIVWRSPVAGVPFRVRFSWLECDLSGKECSALPGLAGKEAVVPPQEPRIVTLRAVETATNRFGSNSVTSLNFYYDMAGFPFKNSGWMDQHLQYDPDQLRAWYGLSPGQNGAGQTILIPDFGRVEGLRAAVDHFSAHYGLPATCRAQQTRGCFQLVVSSAGRKPKDVWRGGEAEAAGDVEWAHAIAPRAKIVFVQFDQNATLFEKVVWLARGGQMSVVSDSWCDPCGAGFRAFGRDVVLPDVAAGCDWPHLVCVQASGDHGSPGDVPSESPYVLAVGGTRFEPLPDGATGKEIPWGPSGSGDSDIPVRRPAWQKNVTGGCSHVGGSFSCAERAVPDVSALAASVPVFTPTSEGWIYFDGTSLSTPLWAALIALTDQQLQQDGQRPVGINELHQVLYRGDVSSGLDDIPPHGWDWATGLGSPKAGIVDALTRAIENYRQH